MAVETTADSAPRGTAGAEPWPAPREAWYAVFVFSLVLMMNFLDRGIITLLFPYLKRDLGLSDVQLGLVTGVAFAVFYTFFGLPIARWADVGVRRTIIGIGVATWSLMTALCGLATNFWQLFLFRVGVGAGEACNGPATFSMMADYFPKEKLPRAIAVLNFGFMAGTGMALIIGGVVIGVLDAMPPANVPFLGELRSWQLAFIIAGVPGLFIAMLLWTVREPPRRGRIAKGAPAGSRPASIPIRDVVRFVVENRSTYVPMFLALAFNVVLAFGTAAWVPAFYGRTFGWSMSDVGLIAGLVILVVWPFGAMCGSWMAERLQAGGWPYAERCGKRLAEWSRGKGWSAGARLGTWLERRARWERRDDANLLVLLWSIILHVPGLIAFPLMPTAWLAVAVSAVNGFVAAWVLGPQNAAIQVVTPNEMRAQVTALFLFIFNILGTGLGPLITAAFTQYVFGAEDMLKYSLVAVAATLGPLAAFSTWWGLKAYAKSVARARAWG